MFNRNPRILQIPAAKISKTATFAVSRESQLERLIIALVCSRRAFPRRDVLPRNCVKMSAAGMRVLADIFPRIFAGRAICTRCPSLAIYWHVKSSLETPQAKFHGRVTARDSPPRGRHAPTHAFTTRGNTSNDIAAYASVAIGIQRRSPPPPLSLSL